MICIKMMSSEQKPDSDQSKNFRMVVVDRLNFCFADHNDGRKMLVLSDFDDNSDIKEDSNALLFEVKGNVYVMQNGKTIASLKVNDW